MEVSKLVEILETKGNKLLKNVKIRWISMLALAKRVMVDITLLVVKMVINFTSNFLTKANLDISCDIEVFYGQIFLLPILKFMNNQMKVAQAQNVFVVEIMW